MKRSGLEARVGAVVVIATVIAIVGTMWFQKFQLVEKRYSFQVVFHEVGGLVVGDPIYINGVERGRVNGMSLQPDRVVVEMAVKEGTFFSRDSRIMLKSLGIMGERFVGIQQGVSDTMVAPGDTLTGELLMGMSEVMGSAGSVLDEVEVTAHSLREISETLNKDGKLRESLTDLAATSKNLRSMTERNNQRVDRAVTRFEHAATMLDSLVSGHYTALDSSLASLARAGGSAEVAADNLAEMSKDLREITARLRAGEGSAGRLLSDDELIERLESTVAGMDSLVKDIRDNPGRYVKFSLF